MIGEVLSIVFDPSHFGLIIFGATIGMVLGAIPGLSGGIAITICLPMTFAMDTYTVICLMCGIWIGSASGSFIGSILLGIPGTSASLATTYDGYPLTRKGEPVRALSAGLVANFMGTVPSLLVAFFLTPILAQWAVKLGAWEYASMIFCAIMMVTGLAKGQLFKGLIVAAFALMLTTVGYSPISSTPRFVLNYYFSGGFSLVSVMMGMFAGRLIILEYAKGERGGGEEKKVKVEGFRFPWNDIKQNFKNLNIPISFFIGQWVGFLPGMGGSLSNLLAYSVAKNRSKYPEEFGEGCIDGVFAPEVANNASVGGAVIPFLALGIPGDLVTALLLGALSIKGVFTGPLIFNTQPELVYTVLGVLLIGAVFLVLLQAAGMRLLPMLLNVPYHYLYPLILVMVFIGAYTNGNNMFVLYCNLAFTLVGLFVSWADLPMGPFMLTFVLGSLFEEYLRKAVSYGRGDWSMFATRPVSCILILVALYSCIQPYLKDWMQGMKKKRSDL